MSLFHGHIGEFNGSAEDWTVYEERLQYYFVANDVTSEEKKKAIFLSVCGPATYRLIRSLVAPAQPNSKSYADLVQLVRDHYQPKPSPIVMRFRFNSCIREQGESVASYIARLRQLTEHCEYGATLEDMLRDKLVCGIADERLQRRLLVEPSLSFEKALKLAQAYESAEENAKVLQQSQTSSSTAEVHSTRTDKSRQQPRQMTVCYRCGGQHLSSRCRFRAVDCRRCGKRGHIARACKSKAAKSEPPAPANPHGNIRLCEEERGRETISSSRESGLYCLPHVYEPSLADFRHIMREQRGTAFPG